jgi:hypothetical protein
MCSLPPTSRGLRPGDGRTCWMAVCMACAGLVGQSVDTAPHADLVRVRVVSRDDGVWETYNCVQCGTRAARVIPRVPMLNAQWYVRDAEATQQEPGIPAQDPPVT